jgi:integrase
MARRRSFGNVRKLASGRWQAQYRWRNKGYTAETTFSCGCRGSCTGVGKCRGWKNASDALGRIRLGIEAGRFDPEHDRAERSRPPVPEPLTVGEFFETWLAERGVGGYARDHYRSLWINHVEPTFGQVPVHEVTAREVSAWYARLLRDPDRPAMRAHAYGLLASMFRTAVDHDMVERSPCRIRGGRSVPDPEKRKVLDPAELDVIVAHTPPRYRAMPLLAAWCSLRFGEVAVLQRGDLDLAAGVVHIRRALGPGRRVKAPKTEAGQRWVTIPPHIIDDLRAHLAEHVAPGRDALLFPTQGGRPMSYSGRDRWWYPAREAAGRPTLRFHELRHAGQTWAALMGADLSELMTRAGQVSPTAALLYLHDVDGRQAEIAAAMSELASGNVTAIASKRRRSG